MELDLPKVIALLVLIGLIVAIFYNRLYKGFKQKSITLVKGPTKFTEDFEKEFLGQELITNRNTFIEPDKGHGITLIWEMNIPNTDGSRHYKSSFNKLKNIITIGESPQIYYHPKKGFVSFIFKYLDNPFYSHYPEIKLENIPLQKWNKYILIIQNRHIRIYMNGKLVKSTSLPNLVMLNFDSIKVGKINNNFLGVVKNMEIYPYPLSNQELLTL